MTVTANATAEQPTWWAARADEQSAHITLYRVVGAKEELLDRVTVTLDTVPTLEDFQMLVKGEHGGGEYLAVQRGAQGQFLMRERFAIAGFPKKATPPADERQPGQLSELALVMQRSDERFAQLLGEMREMRHQPAAVDPLEQVERVANILNRTGGAPQPQKGLLEQITELKQVTDLLGLGGNGSEETGQDWVKSILMEYGPSLLQAMQGQGGAALPPPAGDAVAEPDGQAQLMRKLALLLKGMVQLASYKVPAADTVPRIEEQAGDAWPMLADLIARPDAITLAASMVPEVGNYRPWFEQFRQAVIAPPLVETKTSAPAKPARKTRKSA